MFWPSSIASNLIPLTSGNTDAGKGYVDVSTVDAGTAQKVAKVPSLAVFAAC